MTLTEFVPDQIWIREYPIRFAGVKVNARMTIVRLASGGLFVHSPCEFDRALTEEVTSLGRVEAIVAPGNFHYLFVASCQNVFPNARTFICPGVEKKLPELRYETLLVVDAIENVHDETPGTSLSLRVWFEIFRMWNRAKPAPEYQLGWKDKAAARACLERVLDWDFERIVLSHGELVTEDAKAVARQAWCKIVALPRFSWVSAFRPGVGRGRGRLERSRWLS